MNILFLDSIDAKTFGGYQNWICLTAPALADRGHNITVAGRPHSEFIRRLKSRAGHINIIELPISGDFHPVTIYKLKNILKKNSIGLIICDFNKDVRLGGLARLFYPGPKIIWHLGLNITKNNFIHRLLTPRLIDAVVVPSESLKSQVVSSEYIAESLITVIPHGIPEINSGYSETKPSIVLRKKYGIPESNLIAVTSGRFVEQKGHKYLIDAAAEIIEQFSDITFLLLGDGSLKDSLQQRIEALKLTKYFVFAGMLDDFNLELSGADLMIHPSVDEPFGFSVLEGMRAGLPVVASRVGGIPEFAIDGETSYLVEPRRSEVISRAVFDLIKSPDRMREFGQAGKRRWKTDFTLGIMASKWEKYLLNLIGN